MEPITKPYTEKEIDLIKSIHSKAGKMLALKELGDVLDGMRSENGTILSNAINAILDEIYDKLSERLF